MPKTLVGSQKTSNQAVTKSEAFRKKGTLAVAFEVDNLKRAWRWIRSNPDARYKKYFRDLYGAYAIIDDWFLNDLSERLKRGTYEPAHACKVYLPKSSGILRPYTLLTVEDQIVYQAMANVIAEKLSPHVRNRYYVETFGHIYAGKTSTWFYKKWSGSYKQFNEGARDAVKSGLKFSASFDLTAFYDSLDHRVLADFLNKFGCDKEFCDFLRSLLVKWTATDNRRRIYIDHGIPQGPLSSGLLSEVVLQYFDIRYRSQKNVRYLRYVDDIRLFASSSSELRKVLIRLDLLSKDVGLFPQSSKIEIHEVKDIEQELKSISSPVESSIRAKQVDQQKLYKRLVELSPHYEIINITRFKFLLAHAKPSSKLSERLWLIYEKNPTFYEAMMRYFQRYKRFPKNVADRFLQEIKTPQIYSMVLATTIETAEGRFPREQEKSFHRAVMALWRWMPNVLPLELQYAIGHWIIKYDLLKSIPRRSYALNLRNWYPSVNTTRGLDNNTLLLPTQTRLLNSQLENNNDDVAMIAAFVAVKRNVPILTNTSVINRMAHALLGEMGLILGSPSKPCGIEKNMARLLGSMFLGANWKTIFVSNYIQAERLAISCRAYAETDITSWVNVTDSFNDLLLNELFLHDPSIGKYPLGKIGTVLTQTSRFARKYPNIFRMAHEFHDKRYESELSHPFVKKSGRPTGPIRYTYLRRGKQLMREAFIELFTKW